MKSLKSSESSPVAAIDFTFDGRKYSGFAGDTIAAALYRAGVRVFSRSFKYHRPRGPMCLAGACPNCLVNVDGVPNERACMAPLQPGMRVRSQHAWPSLRTDVLNIFDRLHRFLPVGFYYKTFIRPRAFWPLYETVLRRAAGLGALDPSPNAHAGRDYSKQYRHAEVVVVGGGPAGMSAALAAADLGARVVLVDENPALGGHLRYDRLDPPAQLANLASYLPDHGPDPSSLAQAVGAHPQIEVLLAATAFGWYEGNLLGVVQGHRLIEMRPQQLVVAAGQIEQPLVFQNNDLPGVFLGSALQRLMRLSGIKPGHRALVVGNHPSGWRVAEDLLDFGVEIVAVAHACPQSPDTPAAARLRAAGVPLLSGVVLQGAQGRSAVQAALLVELDEAGDPLPGTGQRLQCDLISVSAGFVANNALLYQAGAQIDYDPETDNFTPRAITSFPPGITAAGHAVGTQGLAALLLEGRVAGIEAALQVARLQGKVAPQGPSSLTSLKQHLARLRSPAGVAREPAGSRSPAVSAKGFICFCEDVTGVDLRHAIAEGFDDIETLKRYSTVSMGPCQGKMCAVNALRAHARHTGLSLAQTGRTTSRPPYVPVKLGVLAGRRLEPVRLTPMHPLHLAAGARMLDAGQWKRPEHYGDPLAEALAVRRHLGLIDVSTLGKIELRGPDCVPFLERIYTNRFADLKVGRIRYGLMCTEEGVIFDDGIVARLADDRFYLTTTTGGASAVYEWLSWWLAVWGLQVHLVDVTAAYAALNLAGPCARQALAGLVDRDISNPALPYLGALQAEVAGVPARLMRIGFVGELGYEVHVPAQLGPYLWQVLSEAGAGFGGSPFGVEAQRVLRLEKGHIIVGQDTDALSDPFAAGMGWIVALDKPDFIGKAMLLARKSRPLPERLVRFEMLDPEIVPAEGQQIVANARFVGRVTSARYSPVLDKSIGLAWVSPGKSSPGACLDVRAGSRIAPAVVVAGPSYDPEGSRMKA